MSRRAARHIPLLLLTAATLAAAPAPAQEVLPSPEQELASFRDSILTYWGFTQKAADWLRANTRLEIQDWSSNAGGGSWDPVLKTVRLDSLQQEAAVRAYAMAWWDQWRIEHPHGPLRLAEAVVKLSRSSRPKEAAALARSFVQGDPATGWAGYFCGAAKPARLAPDSTGQAEAPSKRPACADPDGLGAPDFDLTSGAPRALVLDREIFGALAAWTMGRHRSGTRPLPESLASFLDPLFTGEIYRTPYYEGGVP